MCRQHRKKYLPVVLKDKTVVEIKSYLVHKKTERSQIQKNIREANVHRNAFIAKNQKNGAKGELENAMLKAIVNQGEALGYTWH
ncbi:hypothetical protein LCGC14_0634110 [marine sediment metagenome]|uniref:Uncharacterized protein n=1 Tax=marine sediment metagenome TaxID=412755 RepID=A0A0F9RKH6_9ZZZZ